VIVPGNEPLLPFPKTNCAQPCAIPHTNTPSALRSSRSIKPDFRSGGGGIRVKRGEDQEAGRIQKSAYVHALGCIRLRVRGATSSRIAIMVLRSEQRPRLTGRQV